MQDSGWQGTDDDPPEPKVYAYQNDPNGAPIRLCDAEGNTVWEAHYAVTGRMDYYGERTVQQALRLQGQYFDEESGLHYNRHRYYDPLNGKFISLDPIGLDGGLNPYEFASDVFGWIDPLGLSKKNHGYHGGEALLKGPNILGGEQFGVSQTEKGWEGCTNSALEKVLAKLTDDQQSKYHGSCAEVDAVSKAANKAGVTDEDGLRKLLEGSSIMTRRTNTQKTMDPCDSCLNATINDLGVTVRNTW